VNNNGNVNGSWGNLNNNGTWNDPNGNTITNTNRGLRPDPYKKIRERHKRSGLCPA